MWLPRNDVFADAFEGGVSRQRAVTRMLRWLTIFVVSVMFRGRGRRLDRPRLLKVTLLLILVHLPQVLPLVERGLAHLAGRVDAAGALQRSVELGGQVVCSALPAC